MIKIYITILVIYLLYYSGNIIYDMFLKKDMVLKQEEGEEYDFSTITDINSNKIKSVSIDDVEQLNTPASFITKELFSNNREEFNETHELEGWRHKFESEEDIDMFETTSEGNDNSTSLRDNPQYNTAEEEGIGREEKTDVLDPAPDVENTSSEENLKDASLKLKQQFNQFLSLAETYVQVVSERDGFKVYHSMI